MLIAPTSMVGGRAAREAAEHNLVESPPIQLRKWSCGITLEGGGKGGELICVRGSVIIAGMKGLKGTDRGLHCLSKVSRISTGHRPRVLTSPHQGPHISS
jgi:hypothetical protein|tara:strand:- start:1445 stop:1744 length:300 start_codon:yes stop_codon:yes gene_type:complete